jgi:hypothetical protein
MTHDAVNHPSHYTSHPARCECGKPIECIQITEHMGFNLGNSIKYLWRADLKGAALEDLNKAIWYVEREIFKRQRAAEAEQAQVTAELTEAAAQCATEAKELWAEVKQSAAADYLEPTPAAVRRAFEAGFPTSTRVPDAQNAKESALSAIPDSLADKMPADAQLARRIEQFANKTDNPERTAAELRAAFKIGFPSSKGVAHEALPAYFESNGLKI